MKEIEFLKEVIKEANEISKKSFTVEIKGAESDLVTNLDLEIENFIIGKIKTEYPEFDIVSEESNANKIVTDNCFIIDPIDATINFANNLPLWGIQASCRKDGKTVAGVISLPRIDEFYWADETGAYLNGKKIHIKEVPLKNTLYTIDGTNNIPCLQRVKPYSSHKRNFGALCASLGFVASGRLHAAVFREDKPWDYEPGLFICEMAGASICSKKGFHAAAINKELLDILEREATKKETDSNIFILHSLNADTLETWGEDIRTVFGEKEVDVYMPEFPIRAESKYEKFKEILEFYINNGKLNKNSIIIAHSIGNPYFIRFCKEENFIPKAYIAVAPGAVYEYPSKRNDYILGVKKQAYVKEDALKYVKDNLQNKYCFYSDEEDNNPEKFTRFISDTDANGIYLKGYNHFDVRHRIYKIPELIKIIDKLL